MRLRFFALIVVLFAAAPVGAASETDKPIAPLLANLGELHYPITTSSERAQVFFDQGLRLLYAFNHAEALRAFREAARLDPDCALAYWGQAMALGPNINAPNPSNDAEKAAFGALQKALERKAKASEREQALIEAASHKFTKDGQRSAEINQAYAEAMKEARERHPDDVEIAALYAAALMNTMPWNYWLDEQTPKKETKEVLAALEWVISKNPDHPGAHHYYIHAVEAAFPERAVPSADRLGQLMPGAGHLVHMPAHIYIRVGRYSDASEANVKAIAADEDYITQCRAQGIYPLAYYPHNIHFLWASATLEGRSAVAIQSARKVAEKAMQNPGNLPAFGQIFPASPFYAYTRFGKWDEILKEPAPPESLPFLTGIWHYARGIALAATGRFSEAGKELEQLAEVGRDFPEGVKIGANTAKSQLKIAETTLAGELAARKGDYDAAIRRLKEAVRLQDRQIYNEPRDWHYPVRQSLGAVLLEAGQAVEAEAVYRDDLKHNPHNGWSLYGLLQTLRVQGKSVEAATVEADFQRAWARADVVLTSSRF